MNPIENFSSKERGLLSVASRHKGTVAFFETRVVPHLEESLAKMYAKHYCEEDLWNYIRDAEWNTYVEMNSAELGLLTTIKDYTNLKGETKPAHFNHNGTYVGSTKKLGNEPVGYVGHFRITEEYFEAYLPENPKRLTDFFRPKLAQAPAQAPEDEEPRPVPKKINRPKKVNQMNDE